MVSLNRRGLLALFGSLAVVAAPASLAGCAAKVSRFTTVRAGTGEGPVDFELKNATDVPVNSLFLAKTETVSGTDPMISADPNAAAIWGSDLITGSAIAVGERRRISGAQPGRWNVRPVDADGRYQHIVGVRLEAGGRYILELYEDGWRVRE